MDRPYVICHIVSALDGRIDGDFFGEPEIRPILAVNNAVREAYACKATIYGTATMAETYAEGFVGELPPASRSYPREDYIAQSDVDSYFAAIDPKGSIAYEGKYIEKRGKVHPIEVLLENVSDDYIAYLHRKDISYIFAGKDALDPMLAIRKLKEYFGIDRVMIAGGGIVDYTFLQAGLIDELSLLIAPLADGRRDTATVFDRSSFLSDCGAVAFRLLECRGIPGDGLHLRYQPKNRK